MNIRPYRIRLPYFIFIVKFNKYIKIQFKYITFLLKKYTDRIIYIDRKDFIERIFPNEIASDVM